MMPDDIYFVYVLYSRKFDKIYIGQTNSLELRLENHNSGRSKYTAKYTPWEFVYSEQFTTRSAAILREKELKSSRGRNYIRKNVLETSGQ